jgi:hypothetical protein
LGAIGPERYAFAHLRSFGMGGFEVVDPGYAALYERAVEVLGADPRVQSVAVGGSIGAGTADQWSDLDLEVVARADDHAALVAAWPEWVAEITPTVFARTPIAPFIINTVTDAGLTFDIAVFAGEKPAFPPRGGAYVVGQLSSTPFAERGAALEYAVAEQLRGLTGPFVSLVQRDEHMRHLAGVPHLLGLLTTVFLAETELPPPGKHWNASYTDEQRATVAALPAVRAERNSIIAFGLAIAELVVTRARPLYPRYGLTWPAGLAVVSASRVCTCLDIDVSAWLH